MKINTTGLRRSTTHEPKSLVAKDSPDDFEYEGVSVSQSGESSVTPKSSNKPYVKVDSPDDFE